MNEVIRLLSVAVLEILNEMEGKNSLKIKQIKLDKKENPSIHCQQKEAQMARNINLDIPLEDIPQLDFDELYKLYIELFSLPTKVTRKSFFIWRVTNRLQELLFVGLDSATKHLLETMDDEPDNATYLPVGTELIKRFKGDVYRLHVLKDGFEFDGQVYKSLSAIALEITGRKISGKEFFGVQP